MLRFSTVFLSVFFVFFSYVSAQSGEFVSGGVFSQGIEQHIQQQENRLNSLEERFEDMKEYSLNAVDQSSSIIANQLTTFSWVAGIVGLVLSVYITILFAKAQKATSKLSQIENILQDSEKLYIERIIEEENKYWMERIEKHPTDVKHSHSLLTSRNRLDEKYFNSLVSAFRKCLKQDIESCQMILCLMFQFYPHKLLRFEDIREELFKHLKATEQGVLTGGGGRQFVYYDSEIDFVLQRLIESVLNNNFNREEMKIFNVFWEIQHRDDVDKEIKKIVNDNLLYLEKQLSANHVYHQLKANWQAENNKEESETDSAGSDGKDET